MSANTSQKSMATLPDGSTNDPSGDRSYYTIQIIEAFSEVFLRAAKQPLPPMVNMALVLDSVEIDNDLRVLKHGQLISGKTMWEELLTPHVQQTLFEALAEWFTWNLKATAPAMPIFEDTLLELIQSYEQAVSVQATKEVVPRTPSELALLGTNEDLEILRSLQSSPELAEMYTDIIHLPAETVVRELSKTLTDGLIGKIAEVSDRAVRSWVSGKHKVQRVNVTKLRVTLMALRILLKEIDPKTSLRWFGNRNRILEEFAPAELSQNDGKYEWIGDGLAPADLLRSGEKYEWVIRAAASYAEEGI